MRELGTSWLLLGALAFMAADVIGLAADNPWHMVIGGRSGSDIIDTVELYNWETGEQCYHPKPFPEKLVFSSGAILNGIPIVCGGNGADGVATTRCYKFDTSSNDWIKLRDLPFATSNAASLLVPGKGWFLFGGNNQPKSWSLAEVGQDWIEGPPVHRANLVNHCAVQINENTTAFFGGAGYPYEAWTLDWNTETSTISPIPLIRQRVGSVCVAIKDVDGPKVAIIGGTSKGMEFWNPLGGTVELVISQLPPEEGAVRGLTNSYIIPISEGAEFIMHSGDKVSHHLGVWRYTAAGSVLRRIGYLLEPRSGHVVLPVPGISCP